MLSFAVAMCGRLLRHPYDNDGGKGLKLGIGGNELNISINIIRDRDNLEDKKI